MPPRRNQSNRNLNQKSEASIDHGMSTRSSRSKSLPSDDEQEDNELFKGFSVQKDTKPVLLTLPFTVQPSVTIDDFYSTLLPACDAILQIHHNEGENQIEFSHIHRRMAQAISKTPDITTAYESLCQHIQSFCNDLPHQISSYCEDAESIGIFWNSIEDKINKIMILFDSLSYKSKTIPEVFSQFCFEAFQTNIEYFKQASKLIIDSYNEYRDTKQKPPIDSSIQFLKETGLFNDNFIPLFIESVIGHIEPIVNDSFENSPFDEYLEMVTKISERELDLATVFGNYSLSLQLNDQINKLIFSSKMDQIYSQCLLPLLKNQEIDSIWTCSKLARSTDAFNSFIHEMALIFEEEANSCFKSSTESTEIDENQDPISKLLRLYKSLTLFCSRACGPQSTRTVRLAFERGFNSQPETVARLLALSVNKLFTEKKIKDEDENDSFDYDVIDQYVGLFRMLSLNDVFETFHTQLLAKRILKMNDKMVAPESFFIEKLKQQCGEEYTKRMEELLKDRADSLDLLNDFIIECNEQQQQQQPKQKKETKQSSQKSKSSSKSSKSSSNKNEDDFDVDDVDVDDEKLPENLISCFRCLAVSTPNVITWASLKKVKMDPPYMISLLLSKYENFYKSKMERRNIIWKHQLATVKLSVLKVPGLDKVKCSGDFAILLLAFNSGNFEDRLKQLKKQLRIVKEENKKKELLKKAQKKQNRNKNESSDNDDTISDNSEDDDDKNGSEEEEEEELTEERIQKEIDEMENEMKKNWNGSLTLKQLAKLINGKKDEIASRLRVLKSKKSCKLLIEEKPDLNNDYVYKVNKKCDAPNGKIVLPSIFQQLAEKDEERAKSAISDYKNYQLDAVIVNVLKAERSIEKDFLFNKILAFAQQKKFLRFKITREFFEKRLQELETKVFLKIDPAGKVHYISA